MIFIQLDTFECEFEPVIIPILPELFKQNQFLLFLSALILIQIDSYVFVLIEEVNKHNLKMKDKVAYLGDTCLLLNSNISASNGKPLMVKDVGKIIHEMANILTLC